MGSITRARGRSFFTGRRGGILSRTTEAELLLMLVGGLVLPVVRRARYWIVLLADAELRSC